MVQLYSAVKGIVWGKVSTPHNSAKNFNVPGRKIKKGSLKCFTLLLVAIFMLPGLHNSLKAQTANAKTNVTTTPEATPAKEGTYQLIFNSRREDKDIQLTTQQLIAIEKLRKDNEVVYAYTTYSDDIRVKILPRSVINASDFKPVPLKYYKEEQSYDEYSQIRYVELQ